MNLSIDRLDQGERIAAGSALALFVCMFLSWFNFGYADSNAWEALNFISPILAIAIVATLGIALAQVREFDLGDINGGLVIFVLGCLASLLVLYRLIDPISAPGVDGGSTNASVEAGAFLGLIAALGIATGGYLATDGKAVDRLKAMWPSAGGAAVPAPPPPSYPAPPSVPPAAPPAPPSGAPAPPAPPSVPPAPPVPPPVPPAPAPAPVAVPVPPEAVPEADVVGSEPPTAVVDPTPPEPPAVTEPEPEPPVDAPSPVVAEAGEGPRSLFCEACGAPMRTQDRFCRKCGREQAPSSAAEG